MSRVLPALATCLLVAAGAGAQPAPPKKPAPKATPPRVLEGTVKGPDGKPVANALVVARPASARWGEQALSARTDAAGAFRIALKEPGPHDVRVEARGLAARRLEKVPPGTPIAVTLEKGGVIEGTVREGSGGAALSGARVEASLSDDPVGLAWEPGAGVVEAVTDVKGRYRLEGLASGLYDVVASGRGFGRARKAGVTPGRSVDLLLLPGAWIAGAVVGPDGKPVARAVVRVQRDVRSWDAPGPTVTDESGGFEIVGLEPGTYSVVVRHKDFAPGLVEDVAVEREAEARADVALGRGAPVVGRLVGPSERPAAGRVTLQDTNGQPAPRPLTEILRGEAGADGRFQIDAVPAGSHVLAVVAPGFTSTRVDVDVRGDEPRIDVGDVALDPGLTIRGHVRDKAGLAIATAQLSGWQRRGMSGQSSEARTEADGAFVLGGLGPGNCRVEVRAIGFGQAHRDLEAGAQNVAFILEPAGIVTGIVVDETGSPVESYRVSAEPADEEDYSGGAFKSVASADGRFSLEDVSPGAYVLLVEAPEKASQTVSSVKVRSGATTDVGRIRLQKGGGVRGQVVSGDGAPVGGATVTVRRAGASFVNVGESPQTLSDGGGVFELRGIAAGLVSVAATHPAFAEGRVPGIDVDPARGPAEVKIVLSSGGRIEGWSRKKDGSPIPGTYVRARSARPGESFSSGPDMVATGPDGSFAVDRVPPGRVQVTLMARSGSRFTGIQSREVEVREGETTPVEFVSRDMLVSGRVTRGGSPAPSLRVTLRGTSSMMMFSGPENVPETPAGPQRLTGVTREDGSYELLVDGPGKHSATIESLDGKVRYWTREVDIPDADAHVLDFNLGEITISGLVVDKQTEEPIPQANVFASPKDGAGHVSATTGPEGRFQMEVAAGQHRVGARAEGYAGDSLDLEVGEAGSSDVRLALSKALSITGRVVDAQRRPVPGIWVSATLQDDESNVLADATVALPDGSFRLGRLLPQPYNLLASNLYGGSAPAGFAVRAGVTPEAEHVLLSLKPGGRVRLRIFDASGAPVAQAFAGVVAVGGVNVMNVRSRAGTSDTQGIAELSVPSGAVRLRATGNKRTGEVTVEVPEGGTVQAEIKLTEAR